MSSSYFNYTEFHLLQLSEDIEDLMSDPISEVLSDRGRSALDMIHNDLNSLHKVLEVLGKALDGNVSELSETFDIAVNQYRSERALKWDD